MENKDIVLITGGAGLIGSEIVAELANQYKVVVIDKLVYFGNSSINQDIEFGVLGRRNKELLNKIIFLNKDITSFYSVINTFIQYKPRYLIHLAAIPVARVAQKLPFLTIRTNILGTLNLLFASKFFGIDRFLYISSSFVYGDFDKGIVDEDNKLKPRGIYGFSKYFGEVATRIILGAKKNFTIIRPSSVYGPVDLNGRVINKLIEKIKLGQEVQIYGKENRFDFTFVSDAAQGIILAMVSKKAKGNVYNISYGQGRTLGELVEILRLWYPNALFSFKEKDNLTPNRGSLNIKKAIDDLGYQPKIDLSKGVEICIQYNNIN